MNRALAACLFMVAMTASVPGLCADASAVKVYDPGELPPSRYTVIKRLWTQDWRSMLWVSTHADSSSAVSAVTSAAASLDADGIVNLSCLNDGGYYCYALAIKLKK